MKIGFVRIPASPEKKVDSPLWSILTSDGGFGHPPFGICAPESPRARHAVVRGRIRITYDMEVLVVGPGRDPAAFDERLNRSETPLQPNLKVATLA